MSAHAPPRPPPPTRPPGVLRAFILPWSRRRGARALDDEVRFHLEMRAADLVRRGLSPDAARAEALRRFGDTDDLRDYCRSMEASHMRRVHAREWVASWAHDARFASRQFRRAPGFVAATVLTLALGIGATTAIFSVVNGVLLSALPYPQPERVVQLWELSRRGNPLQFADPNFDDVRSLSRAFAAIAQIAGPATVSVAGDVAPVRARQSFVSHDFWRVAGLGPLLGRTFVPDEERENGAPAVIVGYGFWQRVLGGGADALGKHLTIGTASYTVVGVMPPALDLPAGTDLWAPRELERRLPSRTAHNWQVVARLAPGVTLDAARRDVGGVARTIAAQYGSDVDLTDVRVVPLREELVGATRPTLLVLLAASAVLLLIACANVANLLVARLTTRRGEVALRLALGAGRARLVQQCLTESLLLAVAGGALGVVLAWVGTRALLALDPARLPRAGAVHVDGAVLLFAFALSLATALGLGLVSAWRAMRGDLREALSASQRTMSGAGSAAHTRRTLVVAQVAMTLVLLVAAGLLGRSFVRLMQVDPGFRTERSLVLDLSVPAYDSAARVRRAGFYRELLSRLSTVPGVAAVGGSNVMPLAVEWGADGTFLELTSPGEKIEMADLERLFHDPARTGHAQYRVVSGGWFAAMHIPLLEGRTFDDRDAPDAPHVAVVSASLAKQRWPGASPIGKAIEFGNMDGDLRPFTIVGVVGDIHEASLADEPKPTLYADYAQRVGTTEAFNVVVAGPGDPAALTTTARAIVHDLRPDVPPRFRTIESIVSTSVADRRFILLLVGVFGGAALLLAALGLYSVIAYLVAQRTRELSIRIALGARGEDIVRMVLGQGGALALVGIVVGAVAALAATRVLGGFLYGVSTTDPIAFGAVVVLLAVVTIAACWVPARRAARVEAMNVLRGG